MYLFHGSNHYRCAASIFILCLDVASSQEYGIVCENLRLVVDENCEASIPPIENFYNTVSRNYDHTAALSGLPSNSLTLGSYQFTVTATHNALGSTETCAGILEVVDETLMEITCTDITVEADDVCKGIVPSVGIATDNCGPIKFESQDPEEGTTVGLGMHDITYTAADDDFNIATCSSKITVEDATAPDVECIKFLEQMADSNCEGTVPEIGSATDNCGIVSAVQSPAAGTKVVVGDHTIIYTVTDEFGNTASCSTQMTLFGTGTLDVTCSADMEVPADENCQATIPDIGSAGGDCVAVGNENQFPEVGSIVSGLGQTVINYAAQDTNSNSPERCTSNLVLVDNTPPMHNNNQGGPICIWPPNQQLFYCESVSSLFEGTDNCDDDPDIVYTGCQASPNDNDSAVCPDCVYDAQLGRVCFRADAGHTYTVEASAVDASGNDSIFTRIINVPNEDASASETRGCYGAFVEFNGYGTCAPDEQNSKGSPGGEVSKGSRGGEDGKGSAGGNDGKKSRGGKDGNGGRGGKGTGKYRKGRNHTSGNSSKGNFIIGGKYGGKSYNNEKDYTRFGKDGGKTYIKTNDRRGGKRTRRGRGKGRSRNGKRALRGKETFV